MDPISVVIGALVAGAGTAVKDTAASAVKDLYQGLKTLIIHKWQEKDDASSLLEDFEKTPNQVSSYLALKIENQSLDKDPEILGAAQQVLEASDPEGSKAGKYRINVGKAKNSQIGNQVANGGSDNIQIQAGNSSSITINKT